MMLCFLIMGIKGTVGLLVEFSLYSDMVDNENDLI